MQNTITKLLMPKLCFKLCLVFLKLFITFVVNLIITEKPARFFILLFQVALQSVIRRGHFKKCNAHGRRHFLVFFSS